MRQFIEIVIGKKKRGRNNLIDADFKIKCPLRKKNGPLRKKHEKRHFAY